MNLPTAFTPIKEMVTLFATRVIRCVLNSMKSWLSSFMFYIGVSKAEQPMFDVGLAHPGSLDPISLSFCHAMGNAGNDVHVGPDER